MQVGSPKQFEAKVAEVALQNEALSKIHLERRATHEFEIYLVELLRLPNRENVTPSSRDTPSKVMLLEGKQRWVNALLHRGEQ